MNLFRHASAQFALALLSSCAALGNADEPVKLRLTSGRQLQAAVSSRTSDSHLWLVLSAGNARIFRPIAWENIVAAEFRQQQLTSRELQSLLRNNAAPSEAVTPVAQTGPNDDGSNPFADDPLETEELALPDASSKRVVVIDPSDLLVATVPPVSSVRFDAHVANWDADVEVDGLVVQVIPVDNYGQVVPIRGTLQVELFGVRNIAFQDAPSKRGRSYERLGQWTQQLVPEYIHSDGGWFKLPFQAAQPEFDPRIGYAGLVHVKLIVPGAGVYEASLDSVRLRPYAPLRDALQRDTGHRFFPTELTGRGKRSW